MIKKTRFNIDYLVWCYRQSLVHIGWQAFLGGVLLIASALIAVFWLHPMWQESREIQAQSKVLQMTAMRQRTIAHQADPLAQLTEFYKLFPSSDSITDTLDKVYAAAAENNIALNQADYSLIPAEGGRLQRYEVSLPLHGKYVQVRNFIAKVLSENKNVALADISFSRNAATDIEVNAQAKFIFFVRDAS